MDPERVGFTDANLSGAQFTDAVMVGAVFADSERLHPSNQSAPNFAGANLRNADFRNIEVLTSVRFTNADLTCADFSGSGLPFAWVFTPQNQEEPNTLICPDGTVASNCEDHLVLDPDVCPAAP